MHVKSVSFRKRPIIPGAIEIGSDILSLIKDEDIRGALDTIHNYGDGDFLLTLSYRITIA
jgi:hypothetical protein